MPLDNEDHNAIHNHTNASSVLVSHETNGELPGISDPITGELQQNDIEQNNDPNTSNTESTHWLMDTDSSLDETDIDMLEDANRDKDVYR